MRDLGFGFSVPLADWTFCDYVGRVRAVVEGVGAQSGRYGGAIT